MKSQIRFGVIFLLLCFWGCAPIQEAGRTLWGSSTRALEKSRDEALIQSFNCSLDACYDTALELTGQGQQPASPPPAELSLGQAQDTFVLFSEDRRVHLFVVMGVPGSINTTEVGVFFTSVRADVVRVEVASLSSYAKTRVADALFAYLARRFENAK